MVTLVVEPGGLYFDLENKIIAAIKPRPAFLPILRLLNGVVEYEEANGLIVTERWQDRNRRATNRRSHLALIPIAKLFAGRDDILIYTPKSSSEYAQSGDPFKQALDNPTVISSPQHYPGPDQPQWKIPVSEWPNVVRRVVENQEPLRKVASDYGVSYETIRRVLRVNRKRLSS